MCPVSSEDGVALPSTPLREAFASTNTFHAVPIISGTNRDEMKLFYSGDNTLTKKRLGALLVARDEHFYDALSGYVSRVWRIRSVDKPAAMMAEAGHGAVYAYRFDWDDSGRLLFMDFRKVFGAAHGIEIPFVFNKFGSPGQRRPLPLHETNPGGPRRLEPNDRRLLGVVRPRRKTVMPRPTSVAAFTTDGGSYLRLDTDNDGGVQVVNDVDTLDRLVIDLRDDPRLDVTERRLIVDEMSDWMFTRPIETQLREAMSP